MGIEIIGKLTQKNNGDFKLVDLADVDYDGTGKSAKQELENKIEEAKNSSTPYDDTEVKTDINNIKTDLGTEELTTTSKKIKGAINELGSQIEEKASKNEIFTMANMGQDIKEAITGGSVAVVGKNTVLEENIVDGQVTKRKTSFYKKTINLCDKDLFVQGKGILSNNGELYDNPDLSAYEEYVPINCEYISYQPFTLDGEMDLSNNVSVPVVFYTTDKAFISYIDIHPNQYIQVPSNAKYIKLQLESIRLENGNFNVLPKKEITGIYLKPYEFEELSEINKELVKIKNGDFIQDGSIEPRKTTFFNIYKNLFDVNKIVVGAILKQNGILEASKSRYYYIFQ